MSKKYYYAVCYNTLDVFSSRENLVKHFTFCKNCCDPNSSEYGRYTNILIDVLVDRRDVALDGVDENVWRVYFEDVGKNVDVEHTNYKNIIKKIENGELSYE